MPDSTPTTNTPEKDYSNLAGKNGQLQLKYAERYKYTENPHWTHTELTLIWRSISADLYQDAVQFAYLYCLPQNYPNKQRWASDLHIMDKDTGKPIIYPGVWRMVNADFDAKKQGDPGIMITFRQGFARILDWTEALQISGTDLQTAPAADDDPMTRENQDERYILCVVPNIDPEHVEDIVTAMRANPTVVDPAIQGQVRAGSWDYALIKPEKQQDGSFYITVMLARSEFTYYTYEYFGTYKQVDVIELKAVPKRIGQIIIDKYCTTTRTGYTRTGPVLTATDPENTGATATAQYGTSEGLGASSMDITIRERGLSFTVISILILDDAGETVYKDYFLGMTKEQAEALNADPATFYNATTAEAATKAIELAETALAAADAAQDLSAMSPDDVTLALAAQIAGQAATTAVGAAEAAIAAATNPAGMVFELSGLSFDTDGWYYAVLTKTYYKPLVAVLNYQSEGEDKVALHVEHGSGDMLATDIAPFQKDGEFAGNENEANASQETNGLFTYHIISRTKADTGLETWPPYTHQFNAWWGNPSVEYIIQVDAQYFASAQAAATFCQTTPTVFTPVTPSGTGMPKIINGVSGHETRVDPAMKNLIWRGYRVTLVKAV